MRRRISIIIINRLDNYGVLHKNADAKAGVFVAPQIIFATLANSLLASEGLGSGHAFI